MRAETVVGTLLTDSWFTPTMTTRSVAEVSSLVFCHSHSRVVTIYSWLATVATRLDDSLVLPEVMSSRKYSRVRSFWHDCWYRVFKQGVCSQFFQ